MAYGGVETAILNWFRKLNRSHFEPYLVCFANPDNSEEPFVRVAVAQGIEVKKIPWGKKKPVLKAATSLKQIIVEQKIDILHTHNCYADVVGIITRLLVPVKTIVTVYVWAKFELKRNLIQLIDKFIIRFFNIVSAHCQDTYVKTARFINKKKLRLLICGFEIDVPHYTSQERQKRRLAHGVKDNEIWMVNVARFYWEKAQDFLLYAFKEIVAKQPQSRLWIMGVGPLEAELKALCTKLELDDVVKFVGFVENLLETLPLFDMQLHPSHMEGVSLAICSGMAAGLPIVASDVGSMSEVIHHEKTGILVKEDDKDGFIDNVCELIKDHEKRAIIGGNAKKFIENDYSLDKAVDAVEDTYFEMMQL
jgi:glycosyltransferase involved in cell wall biosynthesis